MSDNVKNKTFRDILNEISKNVKTHPRKQELLNKKNKTLPLKKSQSDTIENQSSTRRKSPFSKNVEFNTRFEKLSWIEGDDTLCLKSWNGVGDTWWLYNKAINLGYDKYKIYIYSHNRSDKMSTCNKRSEQLFDVIDNPNVEVFYSSDFSTVSRIHKTPFPVDFSKDQILKELSSGSSHSLLPNFYMERGTSLNKIWPELSSSQLSLNLSKWKNDSICKEISKNTIIIHPSTYGVKGGWSDLNLHTIVYIINKLKNNNYKFAFTGGKYDNINWSVFFNDIRKHTEIEPISIVGEHLGTVLNCIKNSIAWIGPINGLSIVSASQGFNTFTTWPKSLSKMVDTLGVKKTSYKYKIIENLHTNKSGAFVHNELANSFISWVSTK
jgi:hypothetical protein